MPNVYDPSQQSGVRSDGLYLGGVNVLQLSLDDLTDVETASGSPYYILYQKPDGSFGFRTHSFGTIKGYYATENDLTTAHPTGATGDGYIVGTDLYIWDTTQWVNAGPFVGPQGPAGADGTSVSVKGSDTWANISAIPSPTIGDLWILSADESGVGVIGDGLLWSGSSWDNVGPLRGPAGPQGDQGIQGIQGDPGSPGADGADGSMFYSGTGAPSAGLGNNQDFYIDDSNGDLYSKSGGTWSVIDNLLGPQGAQGDQGIQGIPGIQGVQGNPGNDGADGSMFYSGTGAPSAGLGNNQDFYIDDASGDLYSKSTGSWLVVDNLVGPQGQQGIQGTQGVKGDTGATGPAGASGGQWFSGSGVPSDGLGADGDYYLDTANGDVYTKASSTWGSPVDNLTGPQGIQGIQGVPGVQGDPGADGADGAVWYSGAGAPSDGNGANGDFYLDTATGDIYTKSGGTWGSAIENITGPAGAQGDPGSAGPGVAVGGSAGQALTKVSGTDYDTGWTDVATPTDVSTGDTNTLATATERSIIFSLVL